MANFSNPRKKFQWRVSFASLKGNEFEFQRVTLPDIELDVVEHGEINSPVKTPGMVHFSNLVCEKLKPNNANDNALRVWIHSIQNAMLGVGLPIDVAKDSDTIELVDELGITTEKHIVDGIWPCKINGLELDRMSSDNVIETIEFAVDYYSSPSGTGGIV